MKSILMISAALLSILPIARAETVASEPELTLRAREAELQEVTLAIRKAYDDETAFLGAFDAANQAWTQYRDAMLEMRFPEEDKRAEYGSVYPIAYAAVRAELTERRIAELRLWLDGIAEGDVAAGSVRFKQPSSR